MPARLTPFYEKELIRFQDEFSSGNLTSAWNHLERAHILGQRYPFSHSYVHWKMLQFGFKIKNRKEIVGQIPRLVFGGVKSFVGTIPTGNPGGANISALKSVPINSELKAIFQKAGVHIG